MWSYFIEIFYAGAHFHLGEIAMQESCLEKAKIYFTKCLQLCPEHQKAREHLKNSLSAGKTRSSDK